MGCSLRYCFPYSGTQVIRYSGTQAASRAHSLRYYQNYSGTQVLRLPVWVTHSGTATITQVLRLPVGPTHSGTARLTQVLRLPVWVTHSGTALLTQVLRYSGCKYELLNQVLLYLIPYLGRRGLLFQILA